MRTLLSVAAALAFAAPAWAGSVVLRAEAEAAGPYVTLGEVAEVSGDPCWGRIFLGESPAAGQTRALDRAAVQARLDFLGIQARVEGAERVLVRAAEARAGARRLLEEGVRADLDRRIRAFPAPVASSWRLSADPLPLPESWEGEVRVLEVSAPDGQGACRARLAAGSEEAEVGVRAERVRRVAVAARALRTHQRVGAGDVEVRELPEREVPPGAIPSAEGCLGCLVLAAVSPEGILLDSNLAAPRLVLRGSVCVLEERTGAVRVRCQAKALSDGRLGETIAFEVLDSGKTVRGRVSAAGEADLGLGEGVR